ncbi:unnamed protein product [Lupinus luteus]|uniref:Uncharacterized protein n=1 Tax=Lupinus luteus TaxID=3873 RepID=A0AAV1WT39_LUPLU
MTILQFSCKRKTQEQQPYVNPNLDPVLLVPGVGGSMLIAVDDQNGTEERVWADGFNAEARVGIPGDHCYILSKTHLFRILKHWLKAEAPDPFYNPLNDYVVLPTAFEIESSKEKGREVEWEIISKDQYDQSSTSADITSLRSISTLHGSANQSYSEAHATVVVHPGSDGDQHVQLNALAVSVDAS